MPKPGDIIPHGPHAGETYVDLTRMVEAIQEEEALITTFWCDSTVKLCGHAGRCAMGAIMHHIGIPDWWTDNHNAFAEKRRRAHPNKDFLEAAVDKVKRVLGLTEEDQDQIISFNDCYFINNYRERHSLDNCRSRAKAVVEFLREEFGPRDVARV